MAVEMTDEVAKALREKFPPDRIGLKPTIWCKGCREKNKYGQTCDNHSKKRCPKAPDGCGQNLTEAHMHISYVGHGDVTDRLLSVDPGWDWEPVAWTAEGLPRFDTNGGLWIRLTVAGVTRIGYGGADGDRDEDGVKEAISDAIKTTAMRFGVALDLWRKGEAVAKDTADAARGQQNGRSGSTATSRPATQRRAAPATTEKAVDRPAAAATPAADRAPTAAAADAQLAKDELRAHVQKMGYKPDLVLAEFERRYGQALRAATDPVRVRAFIKLLDGYPAHELGAAPAAAGAQA